MSDSEKAPPPPIVQSLLAQAPDTKLSDLSVKLQPSDYISKFPDGHLDAIWNNWRLSCYLATAQIFLGSSARLFYSCCDDHVLTLSFSVDSQKCDSGAQAHQGRRQAPVRSLQNWTCYPDTAN